MTIFLGGGAGLATGEYQTRLLSSEAVGGGGGGGSGALHPHLPFAK